MTDRETQQRRDAWRAFQGKPLESARSAAPEPQDASTPSEGAVSVSAATVAVGVFVVLVLLFLFAQCGSSEEEEAVAPTSSVETDARQGTPRESAGQETGSVSLGDISGVWEAPVQGDQDWYSVRLDIAPGDGNGWVIGIDYPELGCGGMIDLAGTESGGDVLLGVERLDYGRARCTDGGDVRVHRAEGGHLYWEWNKSGTHVWAEPRQTFAREAAEAGADHRFEPLLGTAEANGSGGIYLLPGYGQIEAPPGYVLISYESSPFHPVTFWDGHGGVDYSFALTYVVDGDSPHSVSADQLNSHLDWPRYDYGDQEPSPLLEPPYHYGDDPL